MICVVVYFGDVYGGKEDWVLVCVLLWGFCGWVREWYFFIILVNLLFGG